MFSLVHRIEILLDEKKEREEKNEMSCCNSHDTLFSHIVSVKIRYYFNKSKE